MGALRTICVRISLTHCWSRLTLERAPCYNPLSGPGSVFPIERLECGHLDSFERVRQEAFLIRFLYFNIFKWRSRKDGEVCAAVFPCKSRGV